MKTIIPIVTPSARPEESGVGMSAEKRLTGGILLVSYQGFFQDHFDSSLGFCLQDPSGALK